MSKSNTVRINFLFLNALHLYSYRVLKEILINRVKVYVTQDLKRARLQKRESFLRNLNLLRLKRRRVKLLVARKAVQIPEEPNLIEPVRIERL